MKISNLIITIFLFSIIVSCSSGKKLKNESLSPYSVSLEMGFHYKVYHKSTEFSELYLQSVGNEYRVTIRAYENFRSKEVLYENTHQIVSTTNAIEKIKIPINKKQYALEILLFDLSNNKAYSDAIWIDKIGVNEQTMEVFDDKNTAFLKQFITVNNGLQFNYSNSDLPIYIKYFDKNYKPALPPQAFQDLFFSPLKGAKNTLRIPQNEVFTFVKEGLYFIHTDTTSENGIFIKVVDSDFPKLTKAEDLTLSIRYITKNDEYNRLTSKSTDPKNELDRFWLARTSNKERAKALIRLYYSRVQLSNEYFTSYKEGWKTDRGIIFTIFGKPTRVQKTKDSEYWYYKRTPFRNFAEFTFDKKNATFILKRSPILEQTWSSQIYAWRSGEVI